MLYFLEVTVILKLLIKSIVTDFRHFSNKWFNSFISFNLNLTNF